MYNKLPYHDKVNVQTVLPTFYLIDSPFKTVPCFIDCVVIIVMSYKYLFMFTHI